MEDPEAYLRAITAPLARAREGSPYPVARLSVEAVANAFVVLGLLPAARAEEILAAQRPVLEAAGFRVGREIGELSVNPGARIFQEARAAVLGQPAADPAGGRCWSRALPAPAPRPRHHVGHADPGRDPAALSRRRAGRRPRRGPRSRPGDHRGHRGTVDYRRRRRNVPGARGQRARHDLRAVLRVRRDAMDPRRGVPGRTRPRRGRFARRPVPPSGGWSSPRDPAHPSGSRSRRPPRCRRVPRSRPGRPRRSATWTSSHRRITTGRSAPSRPARWNSTPRPSWPPSPTRCSPSARCRRTARCSPASRTGCGRTGSWP